MKWAPQIILFPLTGMAAIGFVELINEKIKAV